MVTLVILLVSVTLTGCPDKPTPSMPDHGKPVSSQRDRTSSASGGSTIVAHHPPSLHDNRLQTPQLLAEVSAALDAIRVRQNCNRVMGCRVGEKLVSYGTLATGPIISLLKNTPHNAHYWPKLAKIIGKIGDHDAIPFLVSQISTDDGAARAEILAAFGRIRDESVQDILTQFADGNAEAITERDRIAARFSLVKLGFTNYRSALARNVGSFAADRQNPMDTVLALELTLELDMRECLPDFRALSKHSNVFVRAQAVANMATMSDTANFPALIDRLDDELPATRRTALHTLQMATQQEWTTKEDWMIWCQKTHCAPSLPSK